ncbi:MAG TPA: isoleucine--tRNA ligase [bacterium]|nr:isoleucine--tRNA ligase [bacterium]
MTFKPIEKKKLPELELEVMDFWKKDQTFQKSILNRKEATTFSFYDGPPFATGEPHYGHILGSTIKDAVGRYQTMKGHLVNRRWGWDCHGLPIENIAEKELGISGKDEIEKMGVKKFNDFCRSKVMEFADIWGKTVDRMGRWVEFENAYRTMDVEYIESVWWAFKKIHEKGLIYEGEKVLMYCPRCETPMAKAEIAMDNSYKTVKDTTITVKFKLRDEDAFVLAWTTTPWTLPSNLALTVNPNMDYVYLKDKADGTVYIIGQSAVHKYFREESEYEIQKTVKGSELLEKKYEPLMPYFKDLPNSFRIIGGDFVTAEEGTGIVHTAPAFGEVDYEVCKQNNIDFVSPVDKTGRFTAEIPALQGKFVFDTNLEIIIRLKTEGKVVKSEKIAHEYPHCYRCATPLLYRAIPAWFVNIQKVKSRILELNEKISWTPEHLKHGRFENIVREAPDWNISRNRYWATAMPVWKCDDCKQVKVIGSIEELKQEAVDLPADVTIDLHKDFLDPIHLKCACGGQMTRIPEVLDCWFESGSMMFAQFHYPLENKEAFEKSAPADFVAEYIAQTRTWFYYCLVISTILFDDVPYKNIVTTGTIMAEDGNKMSKSLKNFPDPWKLFEKYGVDSLRFYLMHGPLMSNAESINFSEKQVEEIFRNVMMRLWNSFVFFNTYATIDKWEPNTNSKPSENILDQWILSELNILIKKMNTEFDQYNFKVINEFTLFIDNLSNWFIRRSRRRFWKSESDEDKNHAYQTLYTCLLEVSKLMAPFTPFIAEKIYQSLTSDEESVHLQDYPNEEKYTYNHELSFNMNITRKIIEAALSERSKASIKVRQPLATLYIVAQDIIAQRIRKEDQLIEIIKDEVNIKEVIIMTDTELNVLALDDPEKEKMIRNGSDQHCEGNFDFIIKLDTNITEELKIEGLARDVVRQIQQARKEANFNVEDYIVISYETSEASLKKMFETWTDYIAKEVLAEQLAEAGEGEFEFEKDVVLEGMGLKLRMRRVKG